MLKIKVYFELIGYFSFLINYIPGFSFVIPNSLLLGNAGILLFIFTVLIKASLMDLNSEYLYLLIFFYLFFLIIFTKKSILL
jgi:hypothetical protein